MEMVGSPAAGIPNIVGDAAAAVVVAKSEGELHPQTAYRKYAVLMGTIFENCDRRSST